MAWRGNEMTNGTYTVLANRQKDTFVHGFLDVSGSALITGNLVVGSGGNIVMTPSLGSSTLNFTPIATPDNFSHFGINFECSASSVFPNRYAYYGFKNGSNTDDSTYWLTTGDDLYDVASPYAMSSSASYLQTTVGGITIKGHWLQIRSSKALKLQSYSFYTRGTSGTSNNNASFLSNMAGYYVIVGSNDGTTWTKLQDAKFNGAPSGMTNNVGTQVIPKDTSYNLTTNIGSQVQQLTSNNITNYSAALESYTYFRLIVTNLAGGGPRNATTTTTMTLFGINGTTTNASGYPAFGWNPYFAIPIHTLTLNSTKNLVKVGIGITNPTYELDIIGQIHSNGNRPGLYMDHHAMSNNGYDPCHAKMYLEVNNTLTFNVKGNDKLRLRSDADLVNDNFTGQHRTSIKDIPFSQIEPYIGLIVVANQNKFIGMEKIIKTGINAITINESLPLCSLSTTEKDKSCFGVISSAEDENERGVAIGNGTFFPIEKEIGDTRIFINSLGEGAIWVSNINGNLESGDYITSSSVPGYGMKQDSEYLCNYTVAKITMECDFNPLYQPSQTILKDASGNNILDSNGELQWTDEVDSSGNIVYEYTYKIRYILPDGTIITKEEYDIKNANSESVYIAAFVGCTYHCG